MTSAGVGMSEIIKLADDDELERAIARSHERPVWVFKHSLICAISSRARAQYRDYAASAEADRVECTMIEIQNARPISNAVAERLGVRHESPQAILLVDGRSVWDASHSGITARSLVDATARV